MNLIQHPIKLTIFCFLFLASSSQIFAQKKFEPGTIISLDNKIIKGLILKQDWHDTPMQISFKTKKEDNAKTYTAKELSGFIIGIEVYYSGEVIVNKENRDTQGNNNSSAIDLIPEIVFLKAIVLGPKNLFQIIRDNNNYFYYRKDSLFEKLEFKTHVDDPSNPGKKITILNDKYRIQMSEYLKDWPGINESANKLKYRKNSLIRLYKEYYSYTKKDLDFISKPDRVKLEVGPVVGISLSSKEIKGQSYKYFETQPIDNYTEPIFGLFFNLIFPHHKKQWSLYNELIYTSDKFDLYVPSYDHWQNLGNIDLTMTMHNIKMFNLIRYSYSINRFQVFVNAGFSNAFNVSDKITNISDRLADSPTLWEPLLDKQTHEFGSALGTGFHYKKVGLEYRIEYTRGMAPYHVIDIRATRNYFLLNYKF